MEVSVFIENIQKAFGEKVQLPFAFWYSDKQINDDLKKINGCFFKEFEKLIGGEPISLSADRIGCMGGKFYTGFSMLCARHGYRAVTFEIVTDETLLGGFTAEIDGVTYDKSVRGQLRALAHDL